MTVFDVLRCTTVRFQTHLLWLFIWCDSGNTSEHWMHIGVFLSTAWYDLTDFNFGASQVYSRFYWYVLSSPSTQIIPFIRTSWTRQDQNTRVQTRQVPHTRPDSLFQSTPFQFQHTKVNLLHDHVSTEYCMLSLEICYWQSFYHPIVIAQPAWGFSASKCLVKILQQAAILHLPNL